MSRGAAAARRGLPSAASSVSAQADKRFRRREARPGRHRWKKIAWRAGALGAAGLLVILLVYAVGAAILRSPWLAVDHIVVRGNARLSSGEVEALVDGLRGQNILAVSFDEYRKRLMDSPWVAGVTLARVLPATVRIQVAERVPMAVARLGQQLYLVDDQGVIIDEFGPEYREFDLPIVDGLVRSTHVDGPLLDQAGVQVTGLFLDAVRAQPNLRRRVSQIDVSDPHDLVVLLYNDAALLHVGDKRFVERLSMYLQIAPTLRGQMKDIDYVDLRLDDLERVIVRSKTGDR